MLEETYPCPVCRYGEISGLTLMNAFGCHFCQHIFTADLQQNCITMVDGEQPLTWYWNGRRWQGIGAEVQFGWGLWLGAALLVLLPPAMIWLSSRIFPPLPDSPWAWFPDFWAVSAFFGHMTLVIWLWIKTVEFPVLAFIKAWGRRIR